MNKRTNHFHEFRKLDKFKMQNDFVFVDTETTSIKEEGKERLYFKLGCSIFWNRENNQVIQKSYWYQPNLFWDDLESRYSKDCKSIILFAHNCYFDFKILNGFRELFKRNWNLENHYIKGTTFIMTFKKRVTKHLVYTLHLWDTLNYVRKPLADIGESVGYPKLNVDFDNVNDMDLEIYCKRDTEIIFQFIRNLINFLVVNNLSKLKATIGSLSFSAFRHRFYNPNDVKVYIHNWKRAIKLERESYKGGITDNFQIGTFENVYKTDINSMYPYIMKKYKVPTKLVFNGSESLYSSVKLKRIYDIAIKNNYVCIINATVSLDKKNAYILKSVNGKSIFVYGKFKIVICQPEIEFILKYGKIIQIHELNVYECHNIFNDFVDFFYELKQDYLKEGNKINADISKLFLNNQYGKWAQKDIEYEMIKRDSKFFNENREILMLMFQRKEKLILDNDICYLGTIMNVAEVYIIDKKVYALKQTNKNSLESFVAISSFITSYARMLLIKYIKIAKRENVYYCDTDSLFLNDIGYQNLVSNNLVDDYILGNLKNEGIVKASFYAPKFYDYVDMKDLGLFEMFLKNRKCKGIKKGSILIMEDNNKAKYKIDIWEKFKADLKKGNLSEQLIIDGIKEANKLYSKGKVGKDGIVEPFSIRELIQIEN
jgi:hypothetical protein